MSFFAIQGNTTRSTVIGDIVDNFFKVLFVMGDYAYIICKRSYCDCDLLLVTPFLCVSFIGMFLAYEVKQWVKKKGPFER